MTHDRHLSDPRHRFSRHGPGGWRRRLSAYGELYGRMQRKLFPGRPAASLKRAYLSRRSGRLRSCTMTQVHQRIGSRYLGSWRPTGESWAFSRLLWIPGLPSCRAPFHSSRHGTFACIVSVGSGGPTDSTHTIGTIGLLVVRPATDRRHGVTGSERWTIWLAPTGSTTLCG